MAAYTIFVYIVWFLAIYFTLVFLMMLVSQRNKIYDFPETVEGEEEEYAGSKRIPV